MEVDQELFLVHVSSVRLWLLSAFPPEPVTSGDDVRGRRRYRRDTRVVARVHELPALMLVRLILLASPGKRESAATISGTSTALQFGCH